MPLYYVRYQEAIVQGVPDMPALVHWRNHPWTDKFQLRVSFAKDPNVWMWKSLDHLVDKKEDLKDTSTTYRTLAEC